MMATRNRSMVVPPEIMAERRRARARTVRLYAIGAAVVAFVIGGIFAVYNHFAGAELATNRHIAAAMSDYARGHLGGAESELRTALAVKGDDYTVNYDLGIVQLKRGRYTAARAQLRATERLNEGASAYLYAAVAGLAMRRPDLALGDARQAVARAPDGRDTTGALALVDQALGHPAQAARDRAAGRVGAYGGGGVKELIDEAILEQ
jgi:tetratricopeptide (TPR) repeat protein